MVPIQITHARAPAWLAPEYATIDSFNCDETYILLIAVDHFDLYRVLTDGSIEFVKRLPIAARQEPRWSLTEPEVLYYHVENRFLGINVVMLSIVHEHVFTEYDSIDGMGESDICPTGEFVFSGVRKDTGTLEVFVYSLTGGQGPAFVPKDVDGRVLVDIRSLYITPNFIICGTLNGTFLFSHSGKPYGQIIAGQAPHMDVTADNRLVFCSSNDPDVRKNAVVIMDLAAANPRETKRVLLDLPKNNWAGAFHISAGENECNVSDYSFIDPTWTPELWRVPYDQTNDRAEVLCAIPTLIQGTDDEKYTGEPKATRSGKRRIVFSANDGLTVNTWILPPAAATLVPVADQSGLRRVDLSAQAGRRWTFEAQTSGNVRMNDVVDTKLLPIKVPKGNRYELVGTDEGDLQMSEAITNKPLT